MVSYPMLIWVYKSITAKTGGLGSVLTFILYREETAKKIFSKICSQPKLKETKQKDDPAQATTNRFVFIRAGCLRGILTCSSRNDHGVSGGRLNREPCRRAA